MELNSGTVDGIDNPAPEDIEQLKTDANFAVYDREALNIFYIGLNVNMKPFDNEKVRQAFAVAIDRQRIVDEYYPVGSTVAQNFVPDLLTLDLVRISNGMNTMQKKRRNCWKKQNLISTRKSLSPSACCPPLSAFTG